MESPGAARRPKGFRSQDSLAFMAVPLGDLVLLAAFGAIAVWYRKRPEIHKRAMLLAGIGCMVPPAAGRLPFGNAIAATVLAFVALLAACLAHDYFERGRLHPLNLWGSVAILASVPAPRRARADGRVALVCGMDDALGRAARAGGCRRTRTTRATPRRSRAACDSDV